MKNYKVIFDCGIWGEEKDEWFYATYDSAVEKFNEELKELESYQSLQLFELTPFIGGELKSTLILERPATARLIDM